MSFFFSFWCTYKGVPNNKLLNIDSRYYYILTHLDKGEKIKKKRNSLAMVATLLVASDMEGKKTEKRGLASIK